MSNIEYGTIAVEWDDIHKKIEAEKQACLTTAQDLKAKIIDGLRAVGAESVHVSYDGAGDSGNVDHVRIFGKNLRIESKTDIEEEAHPAHEELKNKTLHNLVALTWNRIKPFFVGKEVTQTDKPTTKTVRPQYPLITITRLGSHYYDGEWKEKYVEQQVSLRDAIEYFAEMAIEGHHPGWEINEGAYGELEIDVVDGTVTLKHNVRSEEYYEDVL